VTIVSWGIGMGYALAAADKLAEDGIEAEVIDLRTLAPLRPATVIDSVKKTNRCVTGRGSLAGGVDGLAHRG
jgi:pyruvate dehydrogenase E1 component beta subunit